MCKSYRIIPGPTYQSISHLRWNALRVYLSSPSGEDLTCFGLHLLSTEASLDSEIIQEYDPVLQHLLIPPPPKTLDAFSSLQLKLPSVF